MSLLLYADHNISHDIIRGLRALGFDVLSARDDGTDREPDMPLFERAVALDRIFLTNDRDFFRVARRWWDEHRSFPGIIRVRQNAASVGELIEHIAILVGTSTADEFRDQIRIVPL